MTLFSDIIDQMRLTSSQILANKFWLVGVILFILLFIILAWSSYNNFIKPKLSEHKLNKEFINDEDMSDDILIIYFYTEWCPYCKKARPEWNNFKTYVNNINNTNDYKIKLVSIDCDAQKHIADKYEIEGYPTIKLKYKGEIYDYDAKVTKDNLIEFLNSIVEDNPDNPDNDVITDS
tara:strand:+ start:612 stop:1142 length:531 start_codon:yes stop_codon:yes gene_type:complete